MASIGTPSFVTRVVVVTTGLVMLHLDSQVTVVIRLALPGATSGDRSKTCGTRPWR
jgi:hypothetical protein